MRRRWVVMTAAVAAAIGLALGGPGAPRGNAVAQTAPSLPSCQPAGVQPLTEPSPILQNAAVQSVLQGFSTGFETELREPNALAGVSVAIVYQQAVIWAQSFGCADLAAMTPATPHTVYGAGSVTKMFSATMLMQLAEAGKLNPNDPVNMYLPGAQYQSPSGATVSPTFVELAAHTSGLPRDMLPVPESVPDMLRQLQGITAQSEPGAAYSYSNLGYMLLGAVLAQIAGVPYPQYVEAAILRPLGMTSSGFSVPDTPQPGYATPYVSAAPPQPAPYSSWGLYDPAAGLITTAMDMAQFLKMQLGDGAGVLPPAALQQMRVPVTTDATGLAGSAIGWELYVPGSTGLTFIGKDGDIEGFASQLLFVPSAEIGIFIIANTLNATDPGQIPLQLLEAAEVAIVRLVGAIQGGGDGSATARDAPR